MTLVLNTEMRRTAMLAHIRGALMIEADRADLTPRLESLMDAGAELANKRAPGAPESVAREAVIRFVGYTFEIVAAPEFSHAGIFRRCGAASLLSPWTVRRAGAIKVST